MLKSRNIIINIISQYIGMALINQPLHHVNDILHMIRHTGIHIRPPHMHGVHHLEISINIPVGNRFPVRPLGICLIDNLIVHISKILHKLYFIADMLQIAADHIPGHRRTGIPDMGMIVRCDAADINLDFPRHQRPEYRFLSCQRIIHLDFFHLHSSKSHSLIQIKRPPPHRDGGPQFHSAG